jgi:hypothetical protein
MILVKHISRVFADTSHDLLFSAWMHTDIVGDVVDVPIDDCPYQFVFYLISLPVVDLIVA